MEANEGPVGRENLGLERLDLRPVADHESDVVLPERVVGLLDEPRGMPELDAVPLFLWEAGERVTQPLVVALEGRRQLPEQRPHLRRAQQRLDPLVEALEPGP